MANLVDSDIAVALARYDLLEEYRATRGVGWAAYRRLATLDLRFRLRDPIEAARRCGSAEAAQRLTDFCRLVAPIAPPDDDPLLARLTDFVGIDTGEALLFSDAARNPEALIFTGDKRSLRILATERELADLRSLLAGRVYSLEQTLAEIPLTAEVIAKVRADPQANKAISICFAGTTSDDVLAGLKSYYNDLRAAAPGLLAVCPVLCDP